MRRLLTILLSVLLLGGVVGPHAQATPPTWRLTNPSGNPRLSGFSVGESVRQGQPIRLKIDGIDPSVRIETWRIGHYDGAGALLVAAADDVPLRPQPACILIDRVYDCSGWRVTHTIPTTGWDAGLYLHKLIDSSGREYHIATVVTSTSHAGRTVVMSATATHAAYNSIGGYSLYVGASGNGTDRAHTVSINRPSRASGADKVIAYEVGLIQHLESLGVPLSYTTNGELHRGADAYRGARSLVMLGHDEYWSVEMRQAAHTLRDRGTNLLFLGSNAMYYRIRWNRDLTRVTAYKEAELDPIQGATTTTTYRAAPNANPEARLIGSQYDCDGRSPQTPMIIHNPNFWAFAGTGVKRGDRLASLVGHEVDKAGPESPASVHIAAHSTFECSKRQGNSDVTYYVAPSKAGVLNLGTMGFAYALTPGVTYEQRSVDFARRVLATVVVEGSKGPLGRRHAEAPNYAEVYPDSSVYTTDGEHLVNGRQWRTRCERYSLTDRCFTEIWASTVVLEGGTYVQRQGWVLNNLTYKPSPRSAWRTNALGYPGKFTSGGRQWRTECDTVATGRNACRSYLLATVIETYTDANGAVAHRPVSQWIFNNLVLFSA